MCSLVERSLKIENCNFVHDFILIYVAYQTIHGEKEREHFYYALVLNHFCFEGGGGVTSALSKNIRGCVTTCSVFK
jgi:hypothetical protein